jgi:hypothetical protein
MTAPGSGSARVVQVMTPNLARSPPLIDLADPPNAHPIMPPIDAAKE